MGMSVGGLCATMWVPGIKPGPERATDALKHWAITLAFQGTISQQLTKGKSFKGAIC